MATTSVICRRAASGPSDVRATIVIASEYICCTGTASAGVGASRRLRYFAVATTPTTTDGGVEIAPTCLPMGS